MSTKVTVDVKLNLGSLNNKLEDLVNDKTTMLEVHNALRRWCDPYVPFDTGALSGNAGGTVVVTSDAVTYTVPYARRQYYLNDLSEEESGQTNRTRTSHPLATSYWDEAMMKDRGDEFKKEIADILIRRAKELWR